MLAGDFFYNNFGDKLAGQNLKKLLDNNVELIPNSAVAPFAKCLLVGGGGLLRFPALTKIQTGIISSSDEVQDELYLYRSVCPVETPSGLISIGINYDLNQLMSLLKPEVLCASIRQFDFVTVRDLRTFRFLHKLGVRVDGLIPDVAYLPSSTDVSTFGAMAKTVLICPNANTSSLSKIRGKLVLIYANLVSKLRSIGYQVILCPLQIYRDDQDDLALCLQIASASKSNPHIINSVPSSAMFSSICKRVDVVISGRLHGSIVAARNTTPTISLAYSDKQLAMAEMLGIEKYTFNIFQLDDNTLYESWRSLIYNLQSVKNRLVQRVDSLLLLLKNEMLQVNRWIKRPFRGSPCFTSLPAAIASIGIELGVH